MKTIDTVEGNKIIAEFEGRKFKAYKDNCSYDKEFETYSECEKFILDNKLKDYYPELGWRSGMGEYHTSWDWLMPAVEKAEHCEDTNSRGYSFHFVIFDNECHVYEYLDDDEMPIIEMEGETKLEAAWLAMVAFIEYHNENKKA